MARSALAAAYVVAALATASDASAAGTVVLHSGGVATSANADARCEHEGTGDVDGQVGGDSTSPFASDSRALVTVPCTHGTQTHNHRARAAASATGAAATGPFGTVINASGSASAAGVHLNSSDAHAEFSQEFSVQDEPVSFRLSATGRVQFPAADGAREGMLAPGGYTISAIADCSASFSAPSGCGGTGYSVTLELGVPSGDRDGDGLFDVWETDGIDTDGDQVPELDLPDLGADPDHKDVFLEIDHLTGHALAQPAIDRVVAAFDAAPVANPDGQPGIALHVDNGPSSRMTPGESWGARSDAGELPHQAVLGSLINGDYDWSAFDQLKAASFAPDRAPAFHYVVSAHRFGSATTSSSGISRDLGASDLLVTLGPVFEPGESSGTVEQQAGTLMHELGHNLGLHHGGADDRNYKANYLSVMNYAFQFRGLQHADGTTSLDYSRFSIPLHEQQLDEDHGFALAAGSGPAPFWTIFRCPDGALQLAELIDRPTDWNCDGTAQGVVAADVNLDGGLSALSPFVDWPALIYDGGAIGAGGAQPDATASTEPDVEELLENQHALEEIPAQPTPTPSPSATPAPAAPGTAPGPPAATDEPPALSALRVVRRGRRATAVTLRSSRAGFARIIVERRLTGRRAGRRCVPATRRNRRARRCVRFLVVHGPAVRPVAAGVNRVAVNSRKLAAGRYRVTVTPLSAGQRRPGPPRRAAFRIRR